MGIIGRHLPEKTPPPMPEYRGRRTPAQEFSFPPNEKFSFQTPPLLAASHLDGAEFCTIWKGRYMNEHIF